MKFADRLQGIESSLTMQVMLEAQALRSQGVDVIDLGPGQPDFPSPLTAKEAGKSAIESDFTRYTASAGIAELREAIAKSFNRRWDTSFSLENVIVCSGAKHAIFNVCMSVFNPGCEVLIPSPYWVTFPEVVRICGGVPVEVRTEEREHFVINPGSLEAARTERTAGLIMNSPNNPTGAVIPPARVGEIVDWARRRGVFLLSDETYEQFIYDDARHVSIASLLGATGTDFAVVGSFSKSYSMTGWRIGYCVGPARLVQKIDDLQSHQTGNPASISQKAALAVLGDDPSGLESLRREYARRRAFVLERLARIPGFSCVPPGGAFYVFPRISEAMSATGCKNSAEFSRFLLHEARVATVPGSAFGYEEHIRISYAAPRTGLAKGLDRIEEAVRRSSSQ